MEIGSEYSLQLSDFTIKEDNLYQYLSEYNTLFLDSGRSCLKYLSYALGEGTILLPEYICESIVSSFNNRNIIFYKINDDFSIDIEDLISKISPDIRIILILHYFRAIQSKEILSILVNVKEKYQITIIEDTTQSIFSYLSKRDTFREKLIELNINCAAHWPISDNFSENQMAKVLSTNHAKEISAKIISFPDQRYGKTEMDYLSTEIIRSYSKEDRI